MSNAFVDAVQLYAKNGYEVQSSLSPLHFPGFNLADIPFSYIYRDGVKMSRGGGLAMAELAFLECLMPVVQPRNIFVIGNSFGWTTLALGLMCPAARVVAIDICPRPEEAYGIEVTNELGQQIEADVRAIKAKSPDDVAAVVADNFAGGLDFVLIDGGHTSPQQKLDFEICKSVANEDCVYIFHDVINFRMVDGFVEIANSNDHLASSLLFRTPSGMAISYPHKFAEALAPIITAFTESDDRIKALHQEGRENIAAAKD
ncbi:MAG: class I SAM-dependent methyltransferase [Rhodospirillaceae bacterium]|jgi:predicted O-methyltransferase YrrM|nr:class I SAM-dependent methyltransferase [Rhodospirillaceae bacterium]MBT4940828.1 class I SAM-dependent methyltransferase [Rhodospirillaceae bacterium]MBT5939176.1 class I SAM-dependent methyltransferase [Rhodospirillaceae bacterium]MBT7269105.1 class I SAM-dependent methyltransferase [Rhodospirillaceae bacterium]